MCFTVAKSLPHYSDSVANSSCPSSRIHWHEPLMWDMKCSSGTDSAGSFGSLDCSQLFIIAKSLFFFWIKWWGILFVIHVCKRNALNSLADVGYENLTLRWSSGLFRCKFYEVGNILVWLECMTRKNCRNKLIWNMKSRSGADSPGSFGFCSQLWY